MSSWLWPHGHHIRAGLALLAIAAFTYPAGAAVFTWDGVPDGGGTSTDTLVTTGTNWVGDVAPNTSTNPPVDD